MLVFKKLFTKLKENNFFWTYILFLLLSFSSILSAFFVEYVLEYQPCPLCLYQRIPYYVMICLSLACFKFIKIRRIGIMILIISTIASIILSAYHSGVERKIFTPLESCTKRQSSQILSAQDYLNFINQKEAVSCTEIPFKLFGLSMANFNFIINVFMLYFLLRISKFKRLNAKTTI